MTSSPESSPVDLPAILGGNHRLANLLAEVWDGARKRPWVAVPRDAALSDQVQEILKATTRDVATHPTGRLFTRLISEGPEYEQTRYTEDRRSEGILSDREAIEAVEFVHSYMVNHFKGRLAELLALGPVINRLEQLFGDELGRGALRLFMGNSIRQSESAQSEREHLTQGADGLLLHFAVRSEKPKVAAIVEVKSMRLPTATLRAQLDQHRARLARSLSLEEPDGQVRTYRGLAVLDARRGPALLAVVPSREKLSRNFTRVEVPGDDRLQPRPDPLPAGYRTASAPTMVAGVNRLTLAPSTEELAAAGFAMTFWYMEQAARACGIEDPGQHRLRHMLYCLGLRPLTDRGRELTARLYNIYNYGYALAADSRAMLWPEDFPSGLAGIAPAVRYSRDPKTYELDGRKGWKGWEIRKAADGTRLTFDRTLHRLAPNLEYEVGFHVGASLPVDVEAGVGRARPHGPWCAVAPATPPAPAEPPCPFPWDEHVYRAEIGSLRVRSSDRGTVAVRFVLKARDGRLVPGQVCRLISAFDPVGIQRMD